jgi:hypothetical protein
VAAMVFYPASCTFWCLACSAHCRVEPRLPRAFNSVWVTRYNASLAWKNILRIQRWVRYCHSAPGSSMRWKWGGPKSLVISILLSPKSLAGECAKIDFLRFCTGTWPDFTDVFSAGIEAIWPSGYCRAGFWIEGGFAMDVARSSVALVQAETRNAKNNSVRTGLRNGHARLSSAFCISFVADEPDFAGDDPTCFNFDLAIF